MGVENKNITVFLDRNGVINKDKKEYITRWSQFEFMPHIFTVLRVFNDRGYRVIIVTNQCGVGEGLMTITKIKSMHNRMRLRVYNEGGMISGLYFCPHKKEDNCHCRKPRPGMFLDAKEDFPDIDFNQSFMIGDRWSDMDAASALGIKTCMLIDKLTDLHKCRVEPDFCISDISQAIQLVPTYFENMEIPENKIEWFDGERDKRYDQIPGIS